MSKQKRRDKNRKQQEEFQFGKLMHFPKDELKGMAANEIKELHYYNGNEVLSSDICEAMAQLYDAYFSDFDEQYIRQITEAQRLIIVKRVMNKVLGTLVELGEHHNEPFLMDFKRFDSENIDHLKLFQILVYEGFCRLEHSRPDSRPTFEELINEQKKELIRQN